VITTHNSPNSFEVSQILTSFLPSISPMSSLDHATKSPVVARASIVVKESHLLGGSYRQTPAENAGIGSKSSETFLLPGEVLISHVPLENEDDSRRREHHDISSFSEGYPCSPQNSALCDDECRTNQKQFFQRKGRFLVWPASFGIDATIASSP
jgi:hypothetical protein